MKYIHADAITMLKSVNFILAENISYRTEITEKT